MLRVLTNSEASLLTLSKADERTPFPAENKRTQDAQAEMIFPDGRNFK
jgi:error-prone DNA polymerase